MPNSKVNEVQHGFPYWIRDKSRIPYIEHTESGCNKSIGPRKYSNDIVVFNADAQTINVDLLRAARV